MKRILMTALVCLLALALPLAGAYAVKEGEEYVWEGYDLILTGVELDPMLRPANMPEGTRCIQLTFEVPEALWQDEALCDALYLQAQLESESGSVFAASSSMRGTDKPFLIYSYAVDEDMDETVLALIFEGAVSLEDYAGDWAGKADGKDLTFTLNADGTGSYVLIEGSRRQQYDFTAEVTGNAFVLDNPDSHYSKITATEGTYRYEDGVLTLDIATTFEDGSNRQFTIPCERAGG